MPVTKPTDPCHCGLPKTFGECHGAALSDDSPGDLDAEASTQADPPALTADLAHIALQYRRLERHYESAKSTTDDIAMLDVAHTLRIFADMKTDVTRVAIAKNIRLKFSNPIFEKSPGEKTGDLDFSIPGEIQLPRVKVWGMRMLNRALPTEYEPPPPDKRGPSKKTVTLTFTEWLNSGCLEIRAPTRKHPKRQISREILIRRVANVLGASHPIGCEGGSPAEKEFDREILFFHRRQVGSQPSTYQYLITIARELLESLKPLVDTSSPPRAGSL